MLHIFHAVFVGVVYTVLCIVFVHVQYMRPTTGSMLAIANPQREGVVGCGPLTLASCC